MSDIIKNITVEIEGADFVFNVGRDEYDSLVNSITTTNKTVPFHNFLIDTVEPSQQTDFAALLRTSPSLEIELGSEIMEACKHTRKFSLKKPMTSPNKSSEASMQA